MVSRKGMDAGSVTSSRSKSVLLCRILAQSRNCWPHLAAITALSLLSLPLTLLYPLPLKIAVDNVLGRQPLMPWLSAVLPGPPSRAVELGFAVAVLLGIAVLVNIQALASWWLQTYTGEKLVWDFRAGCSTMCSVYRCLFMTVMAPGIRFTEYSTTRPPFNT